MPIYGNIDYPTGNTKPKYANTGTAINGSKANTGKYYGAIYGVSAPEAANTLGDGKKTAHAGWVSQKQGTGPITAITITGGGAGYANGFLVISSATGGTGANAGYTVNATGAITTVTLNAGGAGFNTAPTLAGPGSPSANASMIATMGGRCGRRTYETLVAMGSITSDDPSDNVFFSGI